MRYPRVVTAAAWLAVLGIVGAGAFFAGRATLAPPEVELEATPVQSVEVREGTLGRSIAIPVTATWGLDIAARAAREGTVTAIEATPGQQVDVGARLYSLDLRPAVAAVGAVPAFRDLAVGLKGDDVRQVQEFLVHQGFSREKVSGTYTQATADAVSRWQKSLGVEQNGVVGAGDLVFFAALPARVALADDVAVGGHVALGDPMVNQVSSEPRFEALLSTTQAGMATQAQAIEVAAGEQRWRAQMESSTTDQSGNVRLQLRALDGGALCGTACAEAIALPAADEGVMLAGTLVLVPETSGMMVPQSALATDASGKVHVTLADGGRRTVEVVLQADGQAIVTGVTSGERVRVLGDES